MAKDSSQPLDQWFEVLVDKVNDALLDVAEEVAEEGVKMVTEAIETRGTGRAWKRTYTKMGVRRNASENGRVWTGDMLGAVDMEAFQRNKTSVVSRFGWTKHYEEYYGLQEAGFDHPFTGPVEGMNAMGDAADNILKVAEDALGKRLKDV